MKLIEYLRERHPRVNALTRAEATLIWIDYPLQAGWVERHGDMDLSPETVQAMKDARANRYAKKSYQKAKAKSERKRKAVKPRQEPKQPLKRETKKQKSERKGSLTKLVKTIVMNGCKDADRLTKHLNKPCKSVLNRKDDEMNKNHFKSI